MPKIYRAMKHDPNNPTQPKLADNASSLGVRCPKDIEVKDGFVATDGNGMSVSDHWTNLPPRMIPIRLGDHSQGYRGKGQSLHCWSMGAGSFKNCRINNDLSLVLKKKNPNGGCVAPNPGKAMTLDEFRSSIYQTQGQWKIDED